MNTRRPSEVKECSQLDKQKPKNCQFSKESLNVYRKALIEKIQKKEELKRKILRKIKEQSLQYRQNPHRNSTSMERLSELRDDQEEEEHQISNIHHVQVVVPLSEIPIQDFEPSPLKAKRIKNNVRKIKLKYGINIPKIDERSVESSQNFKEGFSGSKNQNNLNLNSIDKVFYKVQAVEEVDNNFNRDGDRNKENINSFNISSGRQLNFSKRKNSYTKVKGNKSIFSRKNTKPKPTTGGGGSVTSRQSKKKSKATIRDQIEKLKAQFDIQKQRGNRLNRFKKSRTCTSNISTVSSTCEYKSRNLEMNKDNKEIETPKSTSSTSRMTFKESLRKSQSIKKEKKSSSKKQKTKRCLSSTSPRFYISKSTRNSNSRSVLNLHSQSQSQTKNLTTTRSQYRIKEKFENRRSKKDLKNEVEVRSSVIKKLIGCLDDRKKISELVDHLLKAREENSKLKQQQGNQKMRASKEPLCIR